MTETLKYRKKLLVNIIILSCLFIVYRWAEMGMDVDSYQSGHIFSNFIQEKPILNKEVSIDSLTMPCDFAQEFKVEGVFGQNLYSGTFYTKDEVTVIIVQDYPVRKYFYRGEWHLP